MQENLAETAQISALSVLKEHQKIAYSSIAHMHQTWIERTDFERLTDDQKACIKSISTKVVKQNIGSREEPEIVDVEYVKIELYDKQKSLDAINNMLGYNAPTKQEITGKDGKDLIPSANLGNLSDDELKTYHELLLKANGK
jgi:phage terminase small subunit